VGVVDVIALVDIVVELAAGADPDSLADEGALVGEGVGAFFLEEDVVVGVDLDVSVGIFFYGYAIVVRLVDEANANAYREHQYAGYGEANLESLLHENPPFRQISLVEKRLRGIAGKKGFG
jgi:hypothetical protein